MNETNDAAAAVKTMIEQWVSLSTALADRTLAPGAAAASFDLSAVATPLLGAVNLPTRAEVLAVGAAVAALDARLARIEALLAKSADPIVAEPRSPAATPRSTRMADLSKIREHMNVIGADGVHVGTVDKVEGGRIKLTKDSSTHTQHHHFISGGLVADVEGDDVRLSANGDVAVTFEEEQ